MPAPSMVESVAPTPIVRGRRSSTWMVIGRLPSGRDLVALDEAQRAEDLKVGQPLLRRVDVVGIEGRPALAGRPCRR